MSQPGLVSEVSLTPRGSALAVAALVGDTMLQVEAASDFDADNGGLLDLNGTQLPYLTVVDGINPDDPDNVVLAAPLLVAAGQADWVTILGGGQLLTDRAAHVSFGDGDEVLVPIPYEQRDRWPEGPYTSKVPIEVSDDLTTIIDVPGRTPVIDGAMIAPGSLPIPPASDGAAPATSPAATVIGGIGALFVRWSAIANPDAVTYEVHVSATDGFTPSPATLAAKTPGTSLSVRTLPDGSPLLYRATDGSEVVYFARVVATDVDGAAPAGTQAGDALVQVTGPDVAADYVYGGTVVADQIIGGTITSDVLVSANLRTAASGQRVEINSTGITLWAPDNVTVLASLPTDPTLPASLKGKAELDQTIINGSFALRGTTNEVSKGSSLTLAGKVTDPQSPPTVQLGWKSVKTWLSADSVIAGLTWVNPTGFTPRWGVGLWYFGLSVKMFGTDGSFAGSADCPQPADTQWFNALGGVVYHKATNAFFALGIAGPTALGAPQQWEIRKHTLDAVNPFTAIAPLAARSVVGNVGSVFVNKNPVIGLDSGGTGVGIAYYDSTNHLIYNTINTATCVRTSLGQVATGASPQGAPADLGYLQRDVFDLASGACQYTAHRAGPNVAGYTVPSNPGTRTTTLDWPSAQSSSPIHGAVFGGPDSRFYTFDAAKVLWTYTPDMWFAESSKWWAGYSWADTDVAGTGAHESGLSTKATFTMLKRAQLTLTTPTIPDLGGTDDPDAARFYLGRGSSIPSNAAMFRQADPAVGVTSKLYEAVTFAGVTPPASNFPSSGAAKIVDASGNTLMDALGYSMFAPTGSLQMFAGAAAPVGWVVCDGGTLSRTANAALFAVIGTTYGAGDGSTTFNVPDLRDRVVMGASATRTRGTAGGSNQIAAGQLPLHSHTGTTDTEPDHNHMVNFGVGTGTGSGANVNRGNGATNATAYGAVVAGGAHNHSFTTGNGPGSGGVFEPRHVALLYLIKT
jgi:microcystin-dependent protein